MGLSLVRAILTMPGLGDAAATFSAWRLTRRRYGAMYRRLVPLVAQRGGWSPERLEQHVRAALTDMVGHAAAHVPHYRELFRREGIDPACVRAPADLARLPLLTKPDMQARPEAFLDERIPLRRFSRLGTSGTTGAPLQLYRTDEAAQTSFAYFEARCRRPAGMEFGRLPFIMMGGQLVAPATRTRPPFWVYNHAWKQLYLSSYHLSDRNLPHYVRELRRRPYHAILGYPSSLHALARFMIDAGETPLGLRCAITSSETLFDHQRTEIERAFGCCVFDQYGAGELCVFAAECGHGAMHVSCDYGLVEVLDDAGRLAPRGEVGELVCTSLINFGQVFIRYRIGDRGALTDRRCPCGSALPIIERLEGRVDEVLMTPDGRRIGRLDPVFKGVAHVRECQIVQEAPDSFRVRVVPGAGYHDEDGAEIRRNLADRVGAARITVERVERIARTASGKFPAVVNHVARAPRGDR
ncbi:MAG: phenylacetate--CoA ligase family protein [Phycisphaerales bacterium]|nr:phenylacetate--CoA ligase family protein [Phycisphaerales bacterium]